MISYRFKLLLKLYRVPLELRRINCFSHAGNLTDLLLAMPKEQTHTIALKKQRLKEKKKCLKYAPGNVSLQVLGSGAMGAPRALYVFSDHSRYLFNCGEGTQRLAHEHKMKLSKLEHIFVTHSSWDNIGGLPGVALTIQDVGVPEITLHGPKGIEDIFPATRRFVVLKNMTISKADCSKDKTFEDNVLKINYVPLFSCQKSVFLNVDNDIDHPSSQIADSAENDETDYYAHERGPDPKRKKYDYHVDKESCSEEERRVAMCYVVRLQPRPGSLLLERCVELGVPPGPLLGQLKAGHDVVLNNGVVVTSAEVTSPAEPGPVFLVVEVPSEDYLPALEQELEFSKYQSDTHDPSDCAFLVVHFTPPEIMKHPTYIKFMSKFSISSHHLIMNESNNCMGSLAVHRIQQKLNLLDNSLFPLLGDDSIPTVKMLNNGNKAHESSNEVECLSNSISVIRGKTQWRACLRPSKLIENTGGLCSDPEEYVKEVMVIDGFKEALDELKSHLDKSPDSKEYPNVIFLGTGSCIPNKTRNTSAILLNLSEDASLLLDCGEGTWGQMVRYFGRAGAEGVLRRLRAVYVSHLHADHHLGLVGLVGARRRLGLSNLSTLLLLAPPHILPWLSFYHKHYEPILNHLQLVPNTLMMTDSEKLSTDKKIIIENTLECLEMSQIETCPVVHCPNSFGVAFTHKNGWKLTYSGDTMPCQGLVKIGKNSTILIHEATMEDELIEEAKIKLHSTTSQAIQAGNDMEANFTLLTHFSQRYAKLPRINKSFQGNVGIAFDNMKVRFSDLPKLPLLYPPLMFMFQEDYEELEQKALKRQMKLERSELNCTKPP